MGDALLEAAMDDKQPLEPEDVFEDENENESSIEANADDEELLDPEDFMLQDTVLDFASNESDTFAGMPIVDGFEFEEQAMLRGSSQQRHLQQEDYQLKMYWEQGFCWQEGKYGEHVPLSLHFFSELRLKSDNPTNQNGVNGGGAWNARGVALPGNRFGSSDAATNQSSVSSFKAMEAAISFESQAPIYASTGSRTTATSCGAAIRPIVVKFSWGSIATGRLSCILTVTPTDA